MREKTIREMLGDFQPEGRQSEDTKGRSCITIWLNPEEKARYDHLQEVSRRKFGKKVREILKAAIDVAEGKAS